MSGNQAIETGLILVLLEMLYEADFKLRALMYLWEIFILLFPFTQTKNISWFTV